MSQSVSVTDQDFDRQVLQAETPVLVDFWADWCIPCKMLAPILDELAVEYDGKLKFTKLDVDANPNMAMKYGVRSIPMLVMFKEGKPVTQMVGAVPKVLLKKRLEAALSA